MLRRRFARMLLRLAGWRIVGEPPRVGIVVGAPHTSNWDYVLTLLVMWGCGRSPRVLVKKEIFRGPLGWLLQATGGIPTDRRNPTGLVRRLVAEATSGEPFLLVVAAEGTRKQVSHWRSGFYRLALAASLPITMGFIDGRTRTAGFGPSFVPSGDVRADMEIVRGFYADKSGVRPALRTEPRLREEDRG